MEANPVAAFEVADVDIVNFCGVPRNINTHFGPEDKRQFISMLLR
jgi:hypothetical protein